MPAQATVRILQVDAAQTVDELRSVEGALNRFGTKTQASLQKVDKAYINSSGQIGNFRGAIQGLSGVANQAISGQNNLAASAGMAGMAIEQAAALAGPAWISILGPIGLLVGAITGVIAIMESFKAADKKRTEEAEKQAEERLKILEKEKEGYEKHYQQLEDLRVRYLRAIGKADEAETESIDIRRRAAIKEAKDIEAEKQKAITEQRKKLAKDVEENIPGAIYESGIQNEELDRKSKELADGLKSRLKTIKTVYDAEWDKIFSDREEKQREIDNKEYDKVLEEANKKADAELKVLDEKAKREIAIQNNIREYNAAALEEDLKDAAERKKIDEDIAKGKIVQLQLAANAEAELNASAKKGFQSSFVGLQDLGRRIQQSAASTADDPLKTVAKEALDAAIKDNKKLALLDQIKTATEAMVRKNNVGAFAP